MQIGLSRAAAAAAAVAFIAVASPVRWARAQSTGDGFDIENFHPVSPGDALLMSVQSTHLSRPGQLAVGLMLGMVNDPLVVVDMTNDQRVASVVGTRLGAELGAAYGLGRVEVSAALPFILHQESDADPDAGTMSVSDGGVGDLRLAARGNLLPGGDGHPGLGAGLAVSLPTARGAMLGGQPGPTASPFVAADLRTDKLTLAANVGARVRESQQIGTLDVGSAFIYGVGVGVRAQDAPVWLMAELSGEVAGAGAADSPLEARGGVRAEVGHGLMAEAGYGRGLVHGYGAPDHRLFAGLTWRPEVPRTAQRLVSNPPKAAAEPATPPPNPDPDGDGILAAADQCPDQAEDFDGFNDHDGCPETDNDHDGLADADDRCPNNAEDRDRFQDADGCPDPDNDFDGILDATDQCPDKAEVINGNQDDDGCPDEGKRLVLIGKSKLEIQDMVYFANGKAEILPRSEPLLYQLAKTLERNPWIKKVRIEGHTDDRGSSAYNLDLSNRRATAVRQALIQRGIAERRLEAVGYGEAQPIDSNKTVVGRAHNRRVEFVIVDQDPAGRPPAQSGAAAAPEGGAR